jgi:integrase
LGKKKLDAITDEDVQALKAALATMSAKTVNNVLTVLGKLLKVAVKWKLITTSPCTIELLKVATPLPKFYEFSQYRALVEAATKIEPRTLLVVLLGGDAGLRSSEMVALRWTDVDFRRRRLVIEQAAWKGIVDTPKSGRGRIIPMTDALCSALQAFKHLRGERVFYRDDRRVVRESEGQHDRPRGPQPVTDRILGLWIASAQRRANVHSVGALHILRHTFCSHLAMRGAPAKAVQELAGHKDLTTTLRYMHLSPAAREGAINLLNRREDPVFAEPVANGFGGILETASV